MIDAEPPRELGEPRSNGGVLAQPVEPVVGAREDLLEDVLRVLLGEPKGLNRDREHVAREALHELAPGLVLPGSAASDERSVGDRICHLAAPYNRVSERNRAATTPALVGAEN